MNIDTEQFVDHVAMKVREITRPIEERMNEIEKQPGEPGPKGDVGERGPAGADAVVDQKALVDDILSDERFQKMVSESVAEQYDKNPPENGNDGLGMAGSLIDREGNLTITMSDGTVRELGQVVGQDGRDGLTLNEFSTEYDPDKGLNLRMSDGVPTKTINVMPPIYEHQGFWSKGLLVRAGNTVTHNGSLWIAKKDTDVEPGYKKVEDWHLAARKGADKS